MQGSDELKRVEMPVMRLNPVIRGKQQMLSRAGVLAFENVVHQCHRQTDWQDDT